MAPSSFCSTVWFACLAMISGRAFLDVFRDPAYAVNIDSDYLSNLMLAYACQRQLHNHQINQQIFCGSLVCLRHFITPSFATFESLKAPC
ncbi:MAG: hypothetical protein ACREFL_03655 [Stellaceae bacterium]